MSSVMDSRTNTELVMQKVQIVDMPPLGLNSIHAARALSISPRMLHELTYPRGPIRSKRVGRNHVYPVPELQRFLADGTTDCSQN